MVVTLSVICLASGLSLALVHQVTREPIEYQKIKFVMEPSVKAVLTDYENDPIKDRFKVLVGQDERGREVFKTVFPARKDGRITAVALGGSGKGYHGKIGVMVGITPAGELTGVSIMSHTETPGIGSRITEAKFTDQFQGLSVGEPLEVEGVSGASYSTKGVLAAVKEAMTFYQEHKEKLLAEGGAG